MGIIVAIIVFIAIGIIALFGVAVNEHGVDNILVTIAGIFLLSVSTIAVGVILGEKWAYREALKGNNPYKMEIRYEFQDSIYIPKDTVFIKIEK